MISLFLLHLNTLFNHALTPAAWVQFPSLPTAQFVPSLLCHERLNEANLPGWIKEN
jgi:hypothetical protein